jgi:hypothetical protein
MENERREPSFGMRCLDYLGYYLGLVVKAEAPIPESSEMIALYDAVKRRQAKRVKKLINDRKKKEKRGGVKVYIQSGILLAALRNTVYPLSEPKGELDTLKTLLLCKKNEVYSRDVTIRSICKITSFRHGDYRGRGKNMASIFPVAYNPRFDLLEFNRLIRMGLFPLGGAKWWWKYLEGCNIYLKDGTSMPLKTYVMYYTRIDIAQSLSNAKVKLPDELTMLITRYLF